MNPTEAAEPTPKRLRVVGAAVGRLDCSLDLIDQWLALLQNAERDDRLWHKPSGPAWTSIPSGHNVIAASLMKRWLTSVVSRSAYRGSITWTRASIS